MTHAIIVGNVIAFIVFINILHILANYWSENF